MNIQFEWDDNKDAINQRKHGISFNLAIGVFADPLVVTYEDVDSMGEPRWLSVGTANGITVLLVVHTYPNGDDTVIRIISARKLSKAERKKYGYR